MKSHAVKSLIESQNNRGGEVIGKEEGSKEKSGKKSNEEEDSKEKEEII